MRQMAYTSLNIEIKTNEQVRDILLSAIKPEAEDVRSRRTKVEVGYKDDYFLLSIHAEDITAARAAVNSFIRLIDVVLGVGKVVRDVS